MDELISARDYLRCVQGHGDHSFATPVAKSIYYHLLLPFSATGGGLDASPAHEKDISVTKVVQTMKNIKSVSNFALLP